MSSGATRNMLSSPIAIPPNPSRPTTPSRYSETDESQVESVLKRDRSDTVNTTSSFGSYASDDIQTPQTPSILHVIEHGNIDASSPEQLYLTQARRKSYGFGASSIPSHTPEHVAETPPNLEGYTAPLLQMTSAGHIPHTTEYYQTAPQTHVTQSSDLGDSNEENPLTGHDARDDQGMSALNLPNTAVSRPGFSSAVRKKFAKSKRSLKSIGRSTSESPTPSLSDDESTETEYMEGRPRKHRLRSLLSTVTAGSTVSLRRVISGSQNDHNDDVLEHAPSHTATEAHTRLEAQVQIPIPQSSEVHDSSPPFTDPQSPLMLSPQPSSDNTSNELSPTQTPSYNNVAPPLSVGRKGKYRASTLSAARHRPRLLPSMSMGYHTPAPHMQRISAPPLVARTRAISEPHLVPYAMSRHVHAKITPERNMFEEMLPRELQLLVLRTFIQSWRKKGHGRWEGDTGARRELVKFSRVCKSWQSLCFDGQLWSLCDLTPFAPFMHPKTSGRIIRSASPFITDLRLRGMDALRGSALVEHLMTGPGLSSLTTLDLRGCRAFTWDVICHLIELSPNLKKLNLRGVQAVSAEVLRTLSRVAPLLEELDVSRCWDISLGELAIWLRSTSREQAESLRILRVGGAKGYSPTSAEFLPLVAIKLLNLNVLDLQHCSTLLDDDIKSFVKAQDIMEVPSNIEHLIISGCSSLTIETFNLLIDKLPNITKLEVAGMYDLFEDRDSEDIPLIKMLRSMPKLQRLDLERTGMFGGITDRVLDTLTPHKSQKGPALGKDLVELRIGYAKSVTPEGIIRLIRGCHNLQILEVDNTSANNAVMREFMRRRASPETSLSLIDCRAVTPSAYSAMASSTRPRAGFEGWSAAVFDYDESEMIESDKSVLKTFWSWKRVGVPKSWRDARKDVESGLEAKSVSAFGGYSRAGGGLSRNRRGSWWRDDDWTEERGGCTIM